MFTGLAEAVVWSNARITSLQDVHSWLQGHDKYLINYFYYLLEPIYSFSFPFTARCELLPHYIAHRKFNTDFLIWWNNQSVVFQLKAIN